MAISISWGTSVIYVPKADLTLVQLTPVEIRELNLNWFRLQLKDLEDSEEGMLFPDTHSHNTEVSLGGLTYARVIEILDPYTITFEDLQYAVNLVGANSNVGDKVNVNQVSVRSANSAGLTSSPAIEYASFNGGVSIDTSSSYSGTVYPVGTPQQPVNNFEDGLLIAAYRGFDTFYILGDVIVNNANDYDNMSFVGQSQVKTAINVSSDASVVGCEFYEAFISGALDGNCKLQNCKIETLNYIYGVIEQCLIGPGVITLGGSEEAHFIDCWSGAIGVGVPTIDMGGSGQSLALRNYNGEIKIQNKTGTDKVEIDLNSGKVILDSTVTNGTIIIRGNGTLEDNTTGSAVVDADDLINDQTKYNFAVHINVIEGVTGTHYGKGTIDNPVNNIADALIILEREGFSSLMVHGSLTISQDLSDLHIHGIQHVVDYEAGDTINLNGKVFTDIGFGYISLEGSMSAASTQLQYHNCYLKNVLNLTGSAEKCSMIGDNSILPGSYFSSVGMIFEGDYTTLDMQSTTGTIASLDIDSGYVEFLNSVTGCLIEVNMRGGEIKLNATCTGGEFYAEGYGTLYGDPVALGMTVKENHLLALETIEDQVLDAQTTDHDTSGTVGKAITDAGTGGNPWAAVVEGTHTANDIMRFLLSFISGEATGAGTATVTFKSDNGLTNRIVMTVDDKGNRSSVVLDGSD